MPAFDDWFPTSKHGDIALNVMDFGAYGDGSAHDMTSLGYANLTAVQGDYPSATGMSDTADWCAITECFKHAFMHETSPGVWVPNAYNSYPNRPMRFPAGQYLTRKPLEWTGLSNAHIFGSGNVQLYNETTTAPNNMCVAVLGLQYSRIENLVFQCAGSVNSIAFDLNGPGASINSNGNLFINCNFTSPGGVGCHIGRNGFMGSETTFIRCHAALCKVGFVIDNFNALNYNFLACAGQDCTLNWIRVNTGGNIVVQNAALAANGTEEDGYDIFMGSGQMVVLAARTESKRFINAAYPVSMFNCAQANEGNDMIFVNVGADVQMFGCETTFGRLTGEGSISIEGCHFGTSAVFVNTISAGASNGAGGNLIRITHPNINNDSTIGTPEYWLDGDEVEVLNVVSSGGGAAATNGVWKIHKIDRTHVDLLGSTFVADTYNYDNARIKPGPRFHLRDMVTLGDSRVKQAVVQARNLHVTKRANYSITTFDAGSTFNNEGAVGTVVFTLPSLYTFSGSLMRGMKFSFVVLAAHTVTIQTFNFGSPGGAGLSSRIFRTGGYDTAGTQILNTGVVGSSIDIELVDAGTSTQIPHRWLVRAETGTWTISGTPAGTARAAEEAKIRSRYGAPAASPKHESQ